MEDRTIFFALFVIAAVLLPVVAFLWWPEKKAEEKKTANRDYWKYAKYLLATATCIAIVIAVRGFFKKAAQQPPARTVVVTKEVEKSDVAIGTIWWCKTRDVCQQNHEIVTKFYNDGETMMITAKYIDPSDGEEKKTEYVWAKREMFGTWANPHDGGKWRLQYDAMSKSWVGVVSDKTDANRLIQLNMRISDES